MELFKNENVKKLKILAILFKECNNNCKVCFEKNFTGIPSIEEFIADPSICISSIEKSLKKMKDFDETTLNLMGGELFYNDRIEKSLFQVIQFAVKNNLNVRLTTNLIYKDLSFLKRTIEYLNELNASWQLFSSYDFDFRFNDDSRQTFIKNLNELKAIGVETVIESIRTKAMLHSLQNDDEQAKCFKQIVQNHKVSLNELMGIDQQLTLTYEESIQLWKILIQKYKTSDIRSHFVDHGRNCANVRRITIIGKNIYDGCVPQKLFLQKEYLEKTKYLSGYIQKYDCFKCRYMNVCSLKCPMERSYEQCDLLKVHDWMKDEGIEL